MPEFKTFNLIYGWNYSGKTTLSRIFRCLEEGKLHPDYSTATFELENQIEKYDSNFVLKPNIRVFNSDFIKDNLKWDADSIEPIFLLGAENIELQTELGTRETILEKASVNLVGITKLRQEKQNSISNAMTKKARDVGTFLGIRPFDSRHFGPIVESVKNNPIILNNEDVERFKTQALSNEQRPLIGEINLSISDLNTLKTDIEIILHKQALSDEKIQKLLNNKVLSDWVELGKDLHQEETKCEFCGNTLPTDLLERLNKHFSKDFELLKTEIQMKAEVLKNTKIVSPNALLTETAFYTDIQNDFKKTKLRLEKAIMDYNGFIDSLANDLKAKQDAPFDKLEVTAFVSNGTELEAVLSEMNTVIGQNDKRTTDFTAEKNTAIEKLKIHFAADFAQTETYSVIQIQLESEQDIIDAQTKNIEEQKLSIMEIKSQLNETVKGAGKINEYLRIFFGKDDIQIKPTKDKRFNLMRGTEIAKNLSEGEKTAVAFAYFTAKLEEQNNKICDTVVYIDDPISSLDSNHLFNIYSFIKNTFYEFVVCPST